MGLREHSAVHTPPDVDDAFAQLAASLRIDAETSRTPAVPAVLPHPAKDLAAAAADRMRCQPLERTAFSAKVALACEVARLRCSGGCVSLWSGGIEDLAWRAGMLSALECLERQSPLVKLADEGCPGIERLYDLAFHAHDAANEASRFFDLTSDDQWIAITSKGASGGYGAVRLHRSHVHDFFARAADSRVEDDDVVLNAYPPGCTRVYRIDYVDDAFRQEFGRFDRALGMMVPELPDQPPPRGRGMLGINPCARLSSGNIVLGQRDQELQQLGALIRLRGAVDCMVTAAMPSAHHRMRAREGARVLRRTAGMSLVPPSGFCDCCGSDVTQLIGPATSGDWTTSCPRCDSTWCD